MSILMGILAIFVGSFVGAALSQCLVAFWEVTREQRHEPQLTPSNQNVHIDRKGTAKVKIYWEKPIKIKLWSKHSPCCLFCGTTRKPPHGRGYCRSCYHFCVTKAKR